MALLRMLSCPLLGIAALGAGCSTPQLGATANATVEAVVKEPVSIRIEGLTVEYEGTYITEPLFRQIRQFDSAEYVRALFGDPDAESTLSDGTVIWRWKYRPKSQQSGLFNMFGGEQEKPQPEHITTYIILKDNKVDKMWRG